MAKIGPCEHFAESVSSFSSQYGSESGMSYTACNLAERTNVYPRYGDYTQACVFRTYGPWWRMAPSGQKPVGKTPDWFISEDYIELSYADKIIPESIEIYETYNPGTLVRILACDTTAGTDVDTGQVRWVTLWEGKPENVKGVARVMSPTLKRINFYTDLIRLEFNHELCGYYTELDGVKLISRDETDFADITNLNDVSTFNGLSQKQGDQLSSDFSMLEIGGVKKNGKSFVSEAHSEPFDGGYFSYLPEEVVQLILVYLDLVSLCRLSQTCHLLRSHCYDPMQFTELSLKPFWGQINDTALVNLQTRCKHCQKLDLSWCCIYTNKALVSLLQVCGGGLTCLRLACYQRFESSTLKTITMLCPHLRELDLQSCRLIETNGFGVISKLTSLQRLNVYRTQIDTASIIEIARGCPDLEHINLGSCICLSKYNTILQEIAANCNNLKSLDLWRWKSLSEVGLGAIAINCPLLEELDVGWISTLRSVTGCYRILAKNCRKLRKLFFTANRSVCDEDMYAIAECCPDLEQLDILGTREVSLAAAQKILDSCKKMKFFDVSFCHHIKFVDVDSWRRQYPHVNIKQSFQS